MRLPGWKALSQQRANMNSAVANDTTRLKLKEHLVAEMHRSEKKVRRCTTHTIGIWKVRSMNPKKLQTVDQEMEHTNIAVLGVSEPKWTGVGYFQSHNFK